jgi:hypothetical protein
MKTLRLLTSYRGYRKGETIQATPQLAAYLVERGIAEQDNQAAFFEVRRAEVAVAHPQAEKR